MKQSNCSYKGRLENYNELFEKSDILHDEVKSKGRRLIYPLVTANLKLCACKGG